MNKTSPNTLTNFGAVAAFIISSMGLMGGQAVGQEREAASGWSRFAPKNWIQREPNKEPAASGSATVSNANPPLATHQPRPLTVIDRRTAQRNGFNAATSRLNETRNQSLASNDAPARGFGVAGNNAPPADPAHRFEGIGFYQNSLGHELDRIEHASYQQPPQARVYRTPNTQATDFPSEFGLGFRHSSEPHAPGIPDYQPENHPPYVEERWPSDDQHPIQRPMPHHALHDHPSRRENATHVTSTPRNQMVSPPDFSREPFIDQPTVYPAGEHPVFNENYRSGNYFPGADQGRGYLQSGSMFQGSELRQIPHTATEIAFQLQADNQRLQEALNRLQTENQDLRDQLSEQREKSDRKEQEFQTSLNRIEQLQQRLERRDAELALAIKEKNDIEFRTNEQLKSIEQMLDSVLLNQLTDRQSQD